MSAVTPERPGTINGDILWDDLERQFNGGGNGGSDDGRDDYDGMRLPDKPKRDLVLIGGASGYAVGFAAGIPLAFKVDDIMARDKIISAPVPGLMGPVGVNYNYQSNPDEAIVAGAFLLPVFALTALGAAIGGRIQNKRDKK